MQEKVKARLREYRLLAPLAVASEFTQPSVHLFLQFCTYPALPNALPSPPPRLNRRMQHATCKLTSFVVWVGKKIEVKEAEQWSTLLTAIDGRPPACLAVRCFRLYLTHSAQLPPLFSVAS